MCSVFRKLSQVAAFPRGAGAQSFQIWEGSGKPIERSEELSPDQELETTSEQSCPAQNLTLWSFIFFPCCCCSIPNTRALETTFSSKCFKFFFKLSSGKQGTISVALKKLGCTAEWKYWSPRRLEIKILRLSESVGKEAASIS